jgi:hypothetical protein
VSTFGSTLRLAPITPFKGISAPITGGTSVCLPSTSQNERRPKSRKRARPCGASIPFAGVAASGDILQAASTFNAWFIACTLNNPAKEQIAERWFRPAFRVAFNAWMATDPATNTKAPTGPTYMPEYKLPAATRASALDAAAVAKSTSGENAGATADNYVRITVFLAAVLFLVGIGSTFKVVGVRYALVTLGTSLLILAAILLVQQPGLPR